MKKTFTSLFLILILVVLMSTASYADDTVYTEGALHYTIADESITIIDYFGSDAEITVPAMIAGCPVNVIAANAFVNTAAKVVYLPDTIMTIEEGAIGFGVQVVSKSNTNDPVTSGSTEPENPAIPDEPSSPYVPQIPLDIEAPTGGYSAQPSSPGMEFEVEEMDVSLEELDDVVLDEESELSPEPTPEPTEAPEETEAPEVTAAPEAPAEQKSSSAVILIVAAVAVVAVVVVLLTKKKK